ncbi:MAG TPA: TIR domain-containing protein [Nitrososphaeraceae archaeon]|nr:TIR domain-containing protein [Nitrososphaeraceae archaeon]
MKIFISYSRRDASGTAKEVHDYLTEIGHHEVFINTSDIRRGDEWRNTIQEILYKMKFLHVIFF